MFHFSVLCLYRLHTRLYLNGLGLEAALTSVSWSSQPASLLIRHGKPVGRAPGVQTISRCYTCGLSALLIVGKELAPVRLLVGHLFSGT